MKNAIYLMLLTGAAPVVPDGGPALTSAALSYASSIDAITLQATVTAPTTDHRLPILAVLHGWGGNLTSFTQPDLTRWAAYGFVVVNVAMRGRSGSGGTQDAGGREIQDIIDAVNATVAAYPTYADSGYINILGYSGGGGNVFSCLTRFPDLFAAGCSFFGISDYGYSATDGWYQYSVGDRATIASWVGGTPAQVPDRYHARASVLAITNYTAGHLWLYHDSADTQVPVVNSANIKAALDDATLANYSYNVSNPGDTNRWLHNYPSLQPSLVVPEPVFLMPMAARTYPAWTVPASGTLKVLGYLDTKRFRLTLGTLIEEFGQVAYDMTARTFTITSDTGAATWSLTLKGQTANSSIGATINGASVSATSDGSGRVTYTGSVS